MATTDITIDAPPHAVYESLLDAWTYEVWVGGAKKVRDVDAAWPDPGSRFHHSIGAGPIATRDETRMIRHTRDKLVELEVHLWPIGKGVVRLELEDTGARTHVTMYEDFTDGPAAWGNNAVQQVMIKLRNDVSLDKLKTVVEQRHRMKVREPAG
jgi:hypothetical protein